MVMRQQVWIDRHVQGVLVGRVLLYWSGILIYFGLSIGCFHWWQNPEWTLSEHLWAMFEQVAPCLPTLLLLLPLVVFDIVRLSNRFAGPVYRLRKHLTDLSQNSQTSPLHFRDEDYWQQLAEPINLLQQKLLVLEQQVQTLSFVHQSLQAGALPAEVARQLAADSVSRVTVPDSETIVRDEQLDNDAASSDDPLTGNAKLDVAAETESNAVTPNPPIPPLPSEAAEAFVTTTSH